MRVDQENSASSAASASATNNRSTTGEMGSTAVAAATIAGGAAGPATAIGAASGTSATLFDRAASAASGNPTVGSAVSVGDDVRLNAEDHCNSTVKRFNELLKEDCFERLVDELYIRTLQALEVQTTSGDFALKLGATRGLFKKDAKVASSVDIERTHFL